MRSDVSPETKQLPLCKAEAEPLDADTDLRGAKQAHELVQDKGSHGDDIGPSFGNAKLNDVLKGTRFELVEKGVHLIVGEGVVVHLQGIELFESLAHLSDGGEGSGYAVDVLPCSKKRDDICGEELVDAGFCCIKLTLWRGECGEKQKLQ